MVKRLSSFSIIISTLLSFENHVLSDDAWPSNKKMPSNQSKITIFHWLRANKQEISLIHMGSFEKYHTLYYQSLLISHVNFGHFRKLISIFIQQVNGKAIPCGASKHGIFSYSVATFRVSSTLLWLSKHVIFHEKYTWWIESWVTTIPTVRRKVSRWKRTSYLFLLHR